MNQSNKSFFIIDCKEGDYVIYIDNKLYDVETIQNAVYKYSDKYYIRLFTVNANLVGVRFKEKIIQKEPESEIDLNEFHNTLIEYQIRFDLEKRFGNLREQIYKQAFAPIIVEKNV